MRFRFFDRGVVFFLTRDASLVLSGLFDMIWKLFTSWYIPGTRTTPAGMALFLLFAVLVLRFIKALFPGFIGVFSSRSDSSSDGD